MATKKKATKKKATKKKAAPKLTAEELSAEYSWATRESLMVRRLIPDCYTKKQVSALRKIERATEMKFFHQNLYCDRCCEGFEPDEWPALYRDTSYTQCPMCGTTLQLIEWMDEDAAAPLLELVRSVG